MAMRAPNPGNQGGAPQRFNAPRPVGGMQVNRGRGMPPGFQARP